MKNTIFLFVSILFLSLGACNAQKKQSTNPTPTAEPTVYKGVSDQVCAMEIQFGSAGGGIDGKTLDKVNQLIESKHLASTTKNVGREGETRICLPLTELKGKAKKEFEKQIKKIVKAGTLSSVSIR